MRNTARPGVRRGDTAHPFSSEWWWAPGAPGCPRLPLRQRSASHSASRRQGATCGCAAAIAALGGIGLAAFAIRCVACDRSRVGRSATLVAPPISPAMLPPEPPMFELPAVASWPPLPSASPPPTTDTRRTAGRDQTAAATQLAAGAPDVQRAAGSGTATGTSELRRQQDRQRRKRRPSAASRCTSGPAPDPHRSARRAQTPKARSSALRCGSFRTAPAR